MGLYFLYHKKWHYIWVKKIQIMKIYHPFSPFYHPKISIITQTPPSFIKRYKRYENKKIIKLIGKIVFQCWYGKKLTGSFFTRVKLYGTEGWEFETLREHHKIHSRHFVLGVFLWLYSGRNIKKYKEKKLWLKLQIWNKQSQNCKK